VTKAKISEYSATANDNTDVNGVNIAEGCPPSSMNNMGREIMAALKRFQVGSDGDGVTVGGALVVSGATTANTFSATAVNATGTVTFSGSVILSGTTTANTFSTDLITEKTSAAGVTIDSVLLKDGLVGIGADGSASAPSIYRASDTNTGIFFPAADTIAFAEGGAEAMRIDSSGRVGVGITPSAWSGAGKTIQFGNGPASIGTENNGDGNFLHNAYESPSATFKYVSSGVGALRYHLDINNNIHKWYTAASGTADTNISWSERMRITSAGMLAINTTTAVSGNTSAKLVVKGASGADVGEIQVASNGTLAFDFRNSSGTQAGSITVNASSVAYNTSSDYRLKENILPMTGALATVAQLKPCIYTWKVDGSAGQGFIAHELQEVIPDCVTGEKDATEIRQVEVSPAIPATFDDDGNELTSAIEAVYEEREVPKYQGVDTSFLVATLTAAIQELSAKNDALEARLSALEQA
jgi:hypothetical protein